MGRDLRGSGSRHPYARGRIVAQLVAQAAQRDPEHACGAGAIAGAVLQRLENEPALDIEQRASDEPFHAGCFKFA